MSGAVVRSSVISMSDRQSPTDGSGPPGNRPATDGPGIATAEQAHDRALEALAAEGFENAAAIEKPHRTIGTWVVQATTDAGVVNVHISTADGSTSIASISPER